MDKIKQLLNGEKYKFLKENKHLGNNIILLTLGGSHAYGTNIEGSDLDVRGIAIERPEEIIGLSSFEQFEDRTTDTVIYGLRKIIKLLTNCNPNTIEILGTKDEHILICNKYGKLLKDNIDLFLSKKCIASFGGYANQQMRRLENSLKRNEPDRKNLKHAMHLIRLYLMAIDILDGKGINTYRDKDRDILLDIRNGEYTYEEIFKMANDYEEKLQVAATNTKLPSKPDHKRIEELVMKMNKDVVLGE